MSIEDCDTVDFISIDPATGRVKLSISDHLEWTSGDEQHHLELLQEKINTYLRFIESGELVDVYPSANGRAVEIVVYHRFPVSRRGLGFLADVRAILATESLILREELMLPGDHDG